MLMNGHRRRRIRTKKIQKLRLCTVQSVNEKTTLITHPIMSSQIRAALKIWVFFLTETSSLKKVVHARTKKIIPPMRTLNKLGLAISKKF